MEAWERSSDSSDWPLERLEREIGELAAHIHAAKCRWLLLVAEYDRREGWAEWGCKSCAQWLSWRCALTPPAAREQVRVARRLAELPAIRAAFGSGELSYSQVRALSRVATAELEPALLELARYSTAAQLERTLRAYRGVVERELSPDDHAYAERYLVCEHDDDGSLLLRARLPADEGALLLTALEAARDSLRTEADRPGEADAPAGAETPAETDRPAEPSRNGRNVSAETEAPLGQQAPPSNASALMLMAETLLASGPAERSGGDSYQVIVHVDAEALVRRRAWMTRSTATKPTAPASSTTARCSTPKPPAGSRATRASSEFSSVTGARCRSAAAPGASRRRCGGRSRAATAAASSRAARSAASCMPTTSTTGPTVAPRSWPTSCTCAAFTTGWYTRAATRSSASAGPVSSASAGPTAGG